MIDFEREFIEKYFHTGSRTKIVEAIQQSNIADWSVYEIEDVQCIVSLFMLQLDRAKRAKIQNFYNQLNLENTFGSYDKT